MKKILLLGGSAQQVVAIEKSKELGYYTVLCDYLTDNPGQYVADKFYLISTTDKEAVLNIAIKEEVDGVLAYASDPAAPTAAYVASKLGLLTSPYNSVEILCNKDKFRSFLKEHGFVTPQAFGFENVENALNEADCFSYPIIIKPVDSSGSKGATVLNSSEGLKEALEFAFSYSRAKRVIVEEYIVKKHPYLIGGDIFVIDSKIVLWGLMNCHRDNKVNSLVPVGKSFPLELNSEDIEAVHNTLQRLVDELHIKSCAMNVELIIDKTGRVFLIDVGPRNGGNMIPDLLGMIFDVDVVDMSVKAAMGDTIKSKIKVGTPYYATHNLHSDKNGLFQRVEYSEDIRPFIVKECVYKTQGDEVEYFDNASKAIGIVFLKFESQTQMNYFINAIDENIKVIID